MVPEGWKSFSLGQLYEFKNGLNADKASYGHGIPFVNVMDIFAADQLSASSLRGSVAVSEKAIREFSVKSGDVLFNRTSETIEEIAFSAVYLDEKPAVFGGFVIRGRPKSDSVDTLYSKYLFKLTSFRKEAMKACQGAVRANIGQKDLAKIVMTLPPRPEQVKIAQILSTWDQAIITTERLLENSQKRKKGLMQQLLTGKKRLPGFEGEWEEGRLGDIAVIDSGFSFKSNDFSDSEDAIPIIRMSDFKSGGLDTRNAARVTENTVTGLEKFALRSEDFIFGMSGSLSNYAWIRPTDLPCYLNQRVGRIRAKKEANQLFVTYLFLSDRIQQSILDKAAGAAQLNISVKDLRELRASYPSKEEQNEIAHVLFVANHDISKLGERLNCLKQEKKALMQQLLTGKRRVNVDTEAA